MLNLRLNIQEDSFQFSLEISVESGKNLYGKHFLEYLKENNFNYENTLLDIQDVRDKNKQIKDMKSSTQLINLSQNIYRDNFNSKEHKIFFKKDDNFQILKSGNYVNLNINFKGNSGRYNKELYASVKINTKADYNVCPIYRKGNTNRILGNQLLKFEIQKRKKNFQNCIQMLINVI